MQGIEPKLHMNLTSRIEYYRLLIEAAEDPESQPSEVITQISELGHLYEEYLLNKKIWKTALKITAPIITI